MPGIDVDYTKEVYSIVGNVMLRKTNDNKHPIRLVYRFRNLEDTSSYLQ